MYIIFIFKINRSNYFHIIMKMFTNNLYFIFKESKSLIKDISTTLPPITTPSYAVEFQKAVEEASRGRKIHNVQVCLILTNVQ